MPNILVIEPTYWRLNRIVGHCCPTYAPLSPIMQGLINDAKTALNLTEGNYTMFPVDVPNDTHHSVIVAQVEQASSSSVSASSKASERAIGVCSAVPNGNGHDPYDYTSPWWYARFYLKQYENTKVAEDTPHKITIVEQPKHGGLDEDNGDFQYQPKATYFGKDRVTFLVEVNGKQIKVVYFIQVLETSVLGNTSVMDDCSDYGTTQWKISSLPASTDSTTITYSNLINSAVDAFRGFTDLPAGEVGTTTGEGANAAINLDTSAAATNAMAATLKPGERRVWTGVELEI